MMRIRELRLQNDMSQVQLAIACGVNQNVISNWETEVALPRTRQLPDLAKALNCTIDALFEQPA